MFSVKPAHHWQFGTTADVGIGAEAPDLDSLFAEMARALFSVMTDLGTVRSLEERVVEVGAADPQGLLVAFLSELIYLRDSADLVLGEFEVHVSLEPTAHLRARVRGETWEHDRHRRRIEVKAVTLHQLKLDLAANRAQVILDI